MTAIDEKTEITETTETTEPVDTVKVEEEDSLVDESQEEDTFPYNEVIVYTKPGCQPCKMTKRSMDTLGIRFNAIDIAEHPAAAESLIADGFMTMPVVKLLDGTTWSGYKPELIKALAEKATAAEEDVQNKE